MAEERKKLRLRKAKARLQRRIEGYEETVSRRTDRGRGFRKPGSLKVKR